MTTTCADTVTPELRLALQQALAGQPADRAASSSRHVRARVIGVLTGTAAALMAYDVVLLVS